MAVAPDILARRDDLEVQVASLTTKVANLDDGQRNIISTLNAVNAKIDAKNAPNYPLVLMLIGTLIAGGTLFVAVFGTIGGLVWSQLRAENERVETAIVKLDDKFMPASQVEHEFAVRGERIADTQQAAKERSLDNRHAIEALQHDVVPRGEHEAHWQAERDAEAAVQRQVDDLKSRTTVLEAQSRAPKG